MLFYVIFSSFQDQIMQKDLEDWSYLLKKQELENSLHSSSMYTHFTHIIHLMILSYFANIYYDFISF
jgi:hypothetical protein